MKTEIEFAFKNETMKNSLVSLKTLKSAGNEGEEFMRMRKLDFTSEGALLRPQTILSSSSLTITTFS